MKYNFPVELTPLMTENKVVVPKKLAVVRTDTDEPIGVVSNKYQLVKHGDVVDSFRGALKKIKHTETIKVARNGAQLFATYKLDQEKVEVRKGDIVSLQFIVKNSYDGSNALQIMLGAYRLVCENGMVLGKNFFFYSHKHIGQNNNDVPELIEKLTTQFKTTLPVMQQMAKDKITTPVEKLFAREKVKLPVYLLDEAKVAYENDKDFTRWGFYNALTNAITHKSKRDGAQTALNYGRFAWVAAVGGMKNG